MDVNTVMSNIFGAGSPQDFHHISLSGGQIYGENTIETEAKPNIKYLDVSTPNAPIPEPYSYNSYNSYMSMEGGGGKKKRNIKGAGDDEFPTLANGTYVQDKSFDNMRLTFCLNWYLTNPRYNAIWVVEDDKTVSEYCAKWQEYLKKEGIPLGSVNASKLSASTSAPAAGLRYTKAIFDVYTSPNNNGYDYHVLADFPQIIKADDVLRRTNRAGDVCFFKFISANQILCSTDQKFDKSKTTTLKLLAKCQQAVFILKGSLPSEILDGKKTGQSSRTGVYTMNGGGKDDNITGSEALSEFEQEISEMQDADVAAYNYIAKQVLAQVEETGESLPQAAKKYAKYMSGDYVFSAFKMLADKNCKLHSIRHLKEIAEEDIATTADELLAQTTTEAEVSPEVIHDFTRRIEQCYHKACLSNNPTDYFINRIAKAYSNSSDFKANIVAGYLKNKPLNKSVIKNAFNIMKSLNNVLENRNYSGLASKIGESSALNDIALEVFTEHGPISAIAKAHIPTLVKPLKKKYSILNRKSMRGGSIYGGEGGEGDDKCGDDKCGDKECAKNNKVKFAFKIEGGEDNLVVSQDVIGNDDPNDDPNVNTSVDTSVDIEDEDGDDIDSDGENGFAEADAIISEFAKFN